MELGAPGALGGLEGWRVVRPGPSPTSGPILSPLSLATLRLASFSISLSVGTLDAPPCLSPLEVQGVGSPRRGAHEPHER